MTEALKTGAGDAGANKAEGFSNRQGGDRRQKTPVAKMSASGKAYVDYKETETLRRMTAANGKIGSRRRTGATAHEQRMLSAAIKRARYMALLPYVAATP